MIRKSIQDACTAWGMEVGACVRSRLLTTVVRHIRLPSPSYPTTTTTTHNPTRFPFIHDSPLPFSLLQVKRYEITEVRPDKSITLAMDKQAAAERNRREMVIKAEGEKRAQELKSGRCSCARWMDCGWRVLWCGG